MWLIGRLLTTVSIDSSQGYSSWITAPGSVLFSESVTIPEIENDWLYARIGIKKIIDAIRCFIYYVSLIVRCLLVFICSVGFVVLLFLPL